MLPCSNLLFVEELLDVMGELAAISIVASALHVVIAKPLDLHFGSLVVLTSCSLRSLCSR